MLITNERNDETTCAVMYKPVPVRRRCPLKLRKVEEIFAFLSSLAHNYERERLPFVLPMEEVLEGNHHLQSELVSHC